MRVRQSTQIQQYHDSEWVIGLVEFINEYHNKKELERVKKIFVETYLDNIHEGIHPRVALQKAKSVALCFLILQQIVS